MPQPTHFLPCCNFVQIIWCPVRFQATYSNVGEGNQIPGNQILHQCWYYYAIKQEYSLWCNFQDNQLVSNWKFVDVLHAFSDVNNKKREFLTISNFLNIGEFLGNIQRSFLLFAEMETTTWSGTKGKCLALQI